MTSMTGATGTPQQTSTGTMKRGGRAGDKIPKGMRVAEMSNFTPEQMQLFQQLFSHLGPDSFLSRLAGGDEDIFNEIEAPALKQFGTMQGDLASRFSGMGAGARRSSGFQNVSNQAASDFASQLQSQRQGLQSQALQDLFGMSQQLLGQRPTTRNLYEKQQKGGGWGGAIGAGIGGLGGFFAGGPIGALQGASAGYGIGSQF